MGKRREGGIKVRRNMHIILRGTLGGREELGGVGGEEKNKEWKEEESP